MVIRVSTDRLAEAPRAEAFEGVRQVEGWIRLCGHRGRSLLEATHLRCQAGGRVHSAAECLDCPRFVNYVPIDERHIMVRCIWGPDDLVRDLMTLASQVAVVAPSVRVSDAARRARAIGVKHLLVCTDDTLVGVVCRCRLVPPILAGETVADRMSERLWTISDTDHLSDAAAIMLEHEVGFLPVVRRGVVLGVISRGDLLRAGIEGELAADHRCPACGGEHGVRPHPTIEGVEFCIDCLDKELIDADFEEISCEQSAAR